MRVAPERALVLNGMVPVDSGCSGMGNKIILKTQENKPIRGLHSVLKF